MTVAEITTDQEIQQAQQQLAALGTELAGLPDRTPEALGSGDDRAYHKHRQRQAAIPREAAAR